MFATNKTVTIATFSAIFVVIAYANKNISIVLCFKKWKTPKEYKKWKILNKLRNRKNEKYYKTKEYYWKQCTEMHSRSFAMTASSELTSYWKRSVIPFFYRQIVAIQANIVWLIHKGFETGHRRPRHRYARVNHLLRHNERPNRTQ